MSCIKIEPRFQYQIISGPWEGVEPKVNELLAEGWELQGGVSLSSSLDFDNQYAQAMIKKPKTKRRR